MSLSTVDIEAFFQECGPDGSGHLYEHTIDALLTEFRSTQASTKVVKTSDVGCRLSPRFDGPQICFDKQTFLATVNSWRIPSFSTRPESLDQKSKAYEANLPLSRRLRAHWAAEGYQSTFVAIVVCVQIGMAVWLLVRELHDKSKLHLLGWGLILAKMSAGVLYPTLALMILSSSRALGTWLRKWEACSRFINWDLSQSFHIRMAIVAAFFTVLHVIGHIGGTFAHLSRSAPGVAARTLNNFKFQEPTYSVILSSIPAITGISALLMFMTIILCSLPKIRKQHFELFQASHLLIYPFIGVLMAHGSQAWLQNPMLGYWLAGPALLLLLERGIRLKRYTEMIPVEIVPQTADVVMLVLRRSRAWSIRPGQYILLCVPEVSRYQWHPFTVSSFSDHELRVHIRTSSGDWTKAIGAKQSITAFVDGPFGSPAERFSEFDRAIVIGTGIGITPYIGILHSRISDGSHNNRICNGCPKKKVVKLGQIVDFHWVAREASMFSWFASLLNHLSSVDTDVRISTYLTMRANSIAEHVFVVLTDRGISNIRAIQGSCSDPGMVSPLTGLKNQTKFGRPDFGQILQKNEEDLPEGYTGRIGVFFCGPKYVGMELSDRCVAMTARATRKVSWTFVGEVF